MIQDEILGRILNHENLFAMPLMQNPSRDPHIKATKACQNISRSYMKREYRRDFKSAAERIYIKEFMETEELCIKGFLGEIFI